MAHRLKNPSFVWCPCRDQEAGFVTKTLVAVHRLRKRIAEAVRTVIRDTVETNEQVDEELRQLKLILQSAH